MLQITAARAALVLLVVIGVAKCTAQSRACKPPGGFNWLPQTAHSYNDLDTWSQLIKSGVRSIKLDLAVCTREACEVYSTWDASSNDAECFTTPFDGKEETFCCICLRGDASNRPFLNSPFNTSEDLVNWVRSPIAAATLANRDPPLLLELDFADGFGFSYDLETSPAGPLLWRWIQDFSTAIAETHVALLPLGGAVWTLPADRAVLAGTATPQQRYIHTLPWLIQNGADPWRSHASDPFNRTQVFNEDWTLLWGDHGLCQRSVPPQLPPATRLRRAHAHVHGINGFRGSADTSFSPPLPPPRIAQRYPLKWYEPSSQLGYRSLAKLLGACTALPPALRSFTDGNDGVGVASSSVVSNQPPAMFETLASVAGLGRGLNQIWDVLPVPPSPTSQNHVVHTAPPRSAPSGTQRPTAQGSTAGELDYGRAKLQALPPAAARALLPSNSSDALSTVVLAALQAFNGSQLAPVRIIATAYHRHKAPGRGDVLVDAWLDETTGTGELAGLRTVIVRGAGVSTVQLVSTQGGLLTAVHISPPTSASLTRGATASLSSVTVGRLNASLAVPGHLPAVLLDATAVCAPVAAGGCSVFVVVAPQNREGLFFAVYNASSAYTSLAAAAEPFARASSSPLAPPFTLLSSVSVQLTYNTTNASLAVFPSKGGNAEQMEVAIVFESRDPPVQADGAVAQRSSRGDVDDEIAQAADRRPKLFFVGSDIHCTTSAMQSCTVVLDAMGVPPVRAGFGSAPDLQALSPPGAGNALLLESHTDGQCQAGLIINNADTSRCVLPRPSSDGDWRYVLLQSVRDLLNYNFGEARAFRAAATAGQQTQWSMCSANIVSGKFESGRSVASALYTDQKGLVQGLWLHDGRIVEPVVTDMICGSSDHKPGFVWDQFLLPQPDCVAL